MLFARLPNNFFAAGQSGTTMRLPSTLSCTDSTGYSPGPDSQQDGVGDGERSAMPAVDRVETAGKAPGTLLAQPGAAERVLLASKLRT